MYSYSYSDVYHIVKANYIESNNSLNEEYHQSINTLFYFGAGWKIDQNNETIWSAISLYASFVYFQFNLTDFSLIGSKYKSTDFSSPGLEVDVGEGIV